MRHLSYAEEVVSLPEPSLPQRLAAGDLTALEEIYDRYSPSVYRLALAISGSEADAEDVVQDVLLALVLRRGPRIRDLRLYLLASARRRAISVLRRRKREAPGAHYESALVEASALDPADAAQAGDISRLVGQLPPEQREVILLKVFEDLTFAEIARVVKASPNTAASRYRYAVEKLRRLVGGENDER